MTNADGRLPLVFPPKLPIPAGTSPFHIKGSAYTGLRDRQANLVPGGLKQVLKFIDDPAAREFLSQKFMPSGWYDYLPVLLLVGGAVAATGRSAEDLVTAGAILHAEQDLSGVYRVLLFFTSPEAAIRRMPVIHQQYFDFGNTDARIVGRGVAESSHLRLSRHRRTIFPAVRERVRAPAHSPCGRKESAGGVGRARTRRREGRHPTRSDARADYLEPMTA